MSLSEDGKVSAFKCKITMLRDPTRDGKTWVREVITQASILGAKDTVTLEWVAIEPVEAMSAPEAERKESKIPARGLGIMPTVKIEPIDEDSDSEQGQEKGMGGEFGREQTPTPRKSPRPPREADSRADMQIYAPKRTK